MENEDLNHSNFKYSNGVLAKKLLYRILIFSSLITFIITSIQFGQDYFRDLNSIQKKLNDIEVLNIDSLARSIWTFDKTQTELQLKGLLSISAIQFLELTLDDGTRFVYGSMKGINSTKEVHYPVRRIVDNKKGPVLANLRVIASLDNIKNKLFERFFTVLISQAFKTFVVSFFILWLINKMGGQYLLQIQEYASNVNVDNLQEDLVLEDKIVDAENPDEIDQIVVSINNMKVQLQKDIEERDKLNNMLYHKHRMESLGTLSSGISHDFNNILQGIFNSLYLAQKTESLSPDTLSNINSALMFSQKARDLIEKILVFSRNDNRPLSPTSINLEIDESLKILNMTVPENIKISYTPLENEYFIKSESSLLNQIIINIGMNAFYAMKNTGGTFYIKTSVQNLLNKYGLKDGEYFILEFKDEGVGISEEIQEKIFEPFFTTKSADKGSGLGMAVVHGIIKKHGGFIEVNSKENIGTTFKVYLPTTLGGTQEVDEKFTKITNSNKKILLVDDEKDVVEICAMILEDEGFTVTTKHNPSDALKHLENYSYDLILVDYKMPEMTGDDFALNLKKRGNQTPIILMTGFLTKDIEKSSLFHAIIKKPYTTSEILSAINNVEVKKSA